MCMCVARECVATFRLPHLLPTFGTKWQYQVLGLQVKPRVFSKEVKRVIMFYYLGFCKFKHFSNVFIALKVCTKDNFSSLFKAAEAHSN